MAGLVSELVPGKNGVIETERKPSAFVHLSGKAVIRRANCYAVKDLKMRIRLSLIAPRPDGKRHSDANAYVRGEESSARIKKSEARTIG